MTTVGDILGMISAFAPPETAEAYDNVGLLVGDPARPVKRVLTALDLTMGAVREAERLSAELIVTHHPVFFHARKTLREDDSEGAAVCAMVRGGLSLIAAHTNFDKACPGVNDALCAALGLTDTQVLPEGLRLGHVDKPKSVSDYASEVARKLGADVRVYAPDPGLTVTRVAVLGGAGGDYFPLALEAGAEVFVTGEVRHHEALDAVAQGLALIEAGHYETERPGVALLRDLIEAACADRGEQIEVIQSQTMPFFRHRT